jgi:hypothetical protein
MLLGYRGKKPTGTLPDPEVPSEATFCQDILEGQSNRWYGRGLVQLSSCSMLGRFKNSLDL